MNITKPRQVVYLEYISAPTIQDGECYVFLAIDHYSQFAFKLSVANAINDTVFLEKVQELMNDKDFKRFDHPFELVTYRAPHLEKEINSILNPHKGKVSFSEERIAQHMMPLLEMMFKSFGGR